MDTHRAVMLGCAVIAGACKPSHIILTVADPYEYARDAVEVGVGPDSNRMRIRTVSGEELPIAVTVTTEQKRTTYRLVAVARDANQTEIARGYVTANFEPGGAGSATVDLLAVCGMEGSQGRFCARPEDDTEPGICVGGACLLSRCGDGFVAGDVEECDDGNLNPNDGCSNDCKTLSWSSEVLFGLGSGAGEPLETAFGYPQDIAADSAGNLVFFELATFSMRRYDAGIGKVTRVGGARKLSFEEAGGSITSPFGAVAGLVTDGIGNIYFSSLYNHSVHRLDALSGRVTRVAGTGLPGYDGDNKPAINAALSSPTGVTVDGDGNLLIVDTNNHRIRRVDRETGIITTVAGCGPALSAECVDPGDGGSAINAYLNFVEQIDVDADDNLFLVETARYLIRYVGADDGIIHTIAGDGNAPSEPKGMGKPRDVAIAGDGKIFVTAAFGGQSEKHGLRLIEGWSPGGPLPDIQTIGCTSDGFSGDGGVAREAACDRPWGITIDQFGNVFFADTNNQRIRKITWDEGLGDWIIDTVAGNGDPDVGVLVAEAVEGLPYFFRAAPGMLSVNLIDFADIQYIYLADTGSHQILAYHTSGVFERIAGGTGAAGFGGDGGPAIDAALSYPRSVAVDGTEQLFIADRDNHRIRFIDWPARDISTIAGTGEPGYDDDTVGIDAVTARLNQPSGVVLLGDGDLLVTDTGNHRIRRIDMSTPTPQITTVIGTGTPGFNGDSADVASVQLDQPLGLFAIPLDLFDISLPVGGDVVLFTDRGNQRVRLYINGTIDLGEGPVPIEFVTTLAGNGEIGFEPGFIADATTTPLEYPRAVFPTPDETCAPKLCFLVADGIDRVRLLATEFSQLTMTFASELNTEIGGVSAEEDGGFATAELRAPDALVNLTPEQLVIADRVGGFLRLVDLSADRVDTVAGFPEGLEIDPGPAQLRYARRLHDPRGLAVDHGSDPMVLYVSEGDADSIVKVVLTDAADPSTWTAEPFAGEPNTPGHMDGPVAAARFRGPAGLVFDPATRVLYVVEEENHTLRAITVDQPTASDAVTTIAGVRGHRGFFEDEDLPATAALFNGPTAVARANNGLYVADTGNNRVRLVYDLDNTPRVETVLGDGVPASNGAGPAASNNVDGPRGLAIDRHGNLFVTSHVAIRMVTAGDDHVARGNDSVFTIYGSPARQAFFPDKVTRCLTGLTLSPMAGADGAPGEISADLPAYFVDSCQGYLLRLDAGLEPVSQ